MKYKILWELSAINLRHINTHLTEKRIHSECSGNLSKLMLKLGWKCSPFWVWSPSIFYFPNILSVQEWGGVSREGL